VLRVKGSAEVERHVPIQSGQFGCIELQQTFFTESLILAQNERWRRV
jgi:hypothetical protein